MDKRLKKIKDLTVWKLIKPTTTGDHYWQDYIIVNTKSYRTACFIYWLGNWDYMIYCSDVEYTEQYDMFPPLALQFLHPVVTQINYTEPTSTLKVHGFHYAWTELI